MLLDSTPQLQDIVSAPAASWWPLAVGWYLLLGIALLLIVGLFWSLTRAVKRRRVRRLALRQLAQQPPTSISAVSLLLKQAAAPYFPQLVHYKHQQQHWWVFLQAPLSQRQRQRYQALFEQLPELSYRPASEQQQLLDEYLVFAEFWLRSALPPSRRQRQQVETKHD